MIMAPAGSTHQAICGCVRTQIVRLSEALACLGTSRVTEDTEPIDEEVVSVI